VTELPKPQVLACQFEDGCSPLGVILLDWGEPAPGARPWLLPQGLVLTGATPERFGITVLRLAPDSYRVDLLWDRTRLAWAGVSRAELLASSLGEILRAVGTSLEYLLDQPCSPPLPRPCVAA
jgi:hypothetical protein